MILARRSRNSSENGAVRLLDHYKMLLYFARNRYKNNERSRMRIYFAGLLIQDLLRDLNYTLENKSILEVGGHKGEFSSYFAEVCGADCLNLEMDDLRGDGGYSAPTVIGDGTVMPFPGDSFDFVICRGVIEHVPHPKQMALIEECCRVLRPGGLCLLNTQPWKSFFAGHQLRPFHILPFPIAVALKKITLSSEGIKRFKLNEAKSIEDLDLYPVSMKRVETLVESSGFNVLATKDYHTRFHSGTKPPFLREFLTQSITYLLSKPFSSDSVIPREEGVVVKQGLPIQSAGKHEQVSRV